MAYKEFKVGKAEQLTTLATNLMRECFSMDVWADDDKLMFQIFGHIPRTKDKMGKITISREDIEETTMTTLWLRFNLMLADEFDPFQYGYLVKYVQLLDPNYVPKISAKILEKVPAKFQADYDVQTLTKIVEADAKAIGYTIPAKVSEFKETADKLVMNALQAKKFDKNYFISNFEQGRESQEYLYYNVYKALAQNRRVIKPIFWDELTANALGFDQVNYKLQDVDVVLLKLTGVNLADDLRALRMVWEKAVANNTKVVVFSKFSPKQLYGNDPLNQQLVYDNPMESDYLYHRGIVKDGFRPFKK
ncbi:hypothetical protein [Enterococcus sp. AD013-P3]|uniref:hypothetical protein n=1 Tax=Enterococcus sp. AD013-P3 TaxID=3411036 RepID=UPI003B96502C